MLQRTITVLLGFIIFHGVLFADKLNIIKRKELIHVGVKYEHKPMGFINNNAKIDGFEVDLMKALADKLNIAVKFHQVTSQDRIKQLKSQNIDVLTATMKKQLAKNIGITKTYFQDELVLLVNKDEDFEKLSDFKDKIIATLKGEKNASKLTKKVKGLRVVSFAEFPQAMRSLKRRHIAAILADKSWCQEEMKKRKNKYKIIKTPFKPMSYVMGVDKQETRLISLLNHTLKSLVKNGTYAKIYKKWFLVSPTKVPTF